MAVKLTLCFSCNLPASSPPHREEGYAYQEELGLSKYLADAYDTESGLPEAPVNDAPGNETGLGAYPIFNIGDDAGYTVDSGPGPYIPVWQTSPVLKRNLVNFNLVRDSLLGPDAQRCLDTGEVVIGGFDSAPVGGIDSEAVKTAHYASLLSIAAEEATVYDGDPMSDIFLPVFDSFNADRNTVAVLTATVNWKDFFRGILPYTVNGLNFILENTCDGSHTYEINGQDVTYVGPGDLHESKYSGLRQSANFDDEQKIEDGTRTGLELNQHGCKYSIHVYPSQGFSDDYNTSTPIIITCAVAIIFIFTVIMFIIYDRLVEKRQSIILRKATQTSALVSSLFPENVRDRLMNSGNTDKAGNFMAPNHRLKSYLKGGADSAISDSLDMAPIADLVPHATVLFADISGFTAWSSTRDPAQVFILLQNVYQAFDIIAKRRRVFKVETIGDSYVAVTGLPEPQSNHAVIMAKFAGECLLKMNQVTRDLEVVLGPDTGDLSMRFGVHSGPVTAGVLRGERARFQLFGDTVNTASRMER
jgi:class 3 adenylate cyclase